MGLACCYRAFYRLDELTNRYSNVCVNITEPRTQIPPNIDFLEVLCRDRNGFPVLRDTFSLVHAQKLENLSPQFKPLSPHPLNVILVGIDAASRLNFLREMPQVNEYLLQQLDAVALEEYSVVGTSTGKNVVALFTGLTYGEVRDGCAKNTTLDNCPLLWKYFTKMGYVTSFSDDWAVFDQRFKEQMFTENPTTYYNRPHVVHEWEQRRKFGSFTKMYCFGSRNVLDVLLNYVETITHVARAAKKPYFQLTWSAITHDEHNALELGEPYLLRFLQNFKNSPGRNDTVLVLLADHGQGVDSFSRTPEGLQEYNLPMAFVVLPPWFPTTYSKEFTNLKKNAQKVVTHYDMHETIKNVLQLGVESKATGKTYGTSLFEEIPTRNCMEAKISLKFCRRCYPQMPITTNDTLVNMSALAVLNELNARVEKYPGECVNQTLKHARVTSKWDPRDVTRELCNISGYTDIGKDHLDYRLRLLNISCNHETEMMDLVDVQVTTNPRGAVYLGQVLVKRRKEDGQLLETFLTDDVQVHRNARGRCTIPKEDEAFCMCMR